MTKLKIGLDQWRYDQLETAARQYELALTKIINEFEKIPGTRKIETKDLNLICTGENFAKDVILENSGDMKIGNISLSREKQRGLVDLSGHFGYLKAIEEFQNTWADHKGTQISLKDFEVIDGEAVFKDFERVAKERFSVYIERPETIKLYGFLTKVCETLNSVGFDESILTLLFNLDRRFIVLINGQYQINVELLRRY